ncbi:hypothetical protein [Stackebrandtia soli]|uniref:hypothetical protein n=1 Tax=Stackebrandtia soli TaxID=1892856 RepID=UPI0039ECFDE3
MPRRRPGALRASPRVIIFKHRRLRRLSPRTTAAIHSLRRRLAGNPDIPAAYEMWRELAHRKGRSAIYPGSLGATDCPCCALFTEHPRDILERALHRLPEGAARELRVEVNRLDERIEARTVPDPFAPPGPWWRRWQELP